MVYNFESDEMTYYMFDDKVKVGIYLNESSDGGVKDFEIDFSEIKLE